MSESDAQVRWFRPVLMVFGVAYVLLASSMLIRGVVVMREFDVPEAVVAAPVFVDFFMFFYQLMAVAGVFMVLFGWVTRLRADQLLVARVYFVANALLTWRDLSTSDSRFGNHLYHGSATLIPVAIDVVLTLSFAVLSFGPRAVKTPRES